MIKINFDFNDRRPEDLEQINAMLATMKLQDLRLWVDYLFVAITVVWCIVAGVVSFQVYRWWEKVTYLICYAIIALQLILPLLGAFGIINDWSCFPFSANWMLNATLVAPQLVIMFALVKISRPNPPMLMVPDDDFWHEIINDE